MKEFSLKEIFIRAIGKEEEASSLYQDLSRRVTNQDVRALLKELSLEEIKHKETVKEIQEMNLEVKTKTKRIEDPKITDFFTKPSVNKYSSVQNILQFAIKEEMDARNFYLAWAESTLEESMANLLRRLADEELKHKVKLESMYEKMKDCEVKNDK